MTDYPESFAGAPRSFTEARSDKAKENTGTIWTPRDCLIKMLREIDEGLKVDALIIAFRIPTETRGIATVSYKQATPDNETSAGLCFRIAQMISRDGD